MNFKLVRIDASDIIIKVPSGRELLSSILKKINSQLLTERENSELFDYDNFDILDKKVDEFENKGEKILLLIDNIDRLGMHETELRIVSEFFQSAQHTFQYFKKIGLIIISCRHNWEELLRNPDLGYLDYRNSWQLTLFNSEQCKKLIERRLATSNKKIKDIFSPKALELIHKEAMGIPRYILQVCEQICRTAALKGEKTITEDFIQEIYGHDISENVLNAIRVAGSSSKKSSMGLENIFNYYRYLEINGLHVHTGLEIIKDLKEKSKPVLEISNPYLIGLKQSGVAISTRKRDNKNNIIERLQMTLEVKELFKNLESKGYNVDDFIIHYQKERIRPISDLNLALDEITRKIPDDKTKKYLEECRKKIDSLPSLQNDPRNLILECSFCLESLIRIILIQIYFFNNVKRNSIKKMETEELKREMQKFLSEKKLTFNYMAELEYILNKKTLIKRNKLQVQMMKKIEIQSIIELTKSTIQDILSFYTNLFHLQTQ